jgi:bacterioferritin
MKKGKQIMSTSGTFLSDIKEIRRRARQHLSEGAVTQNYEGKVEDTIALLNHAVATEIVCILRYKFHAVCATGLASEAVKAEFAQHAKEEEQHLDLLAERINQLGGKPNLNPDGVISRAASEYVEGENLVDMIKENLVAERIAIETYRDMVRHFGNKDVTTRVLLERILAQEEEHANDMHDLLVTHEGRPMLEKVECRPRMRSESWRKFVGRKAYCGTGTWELTDHQNIGGLPSPRADARATFDSRDAARWRGTQ